MHVDFLLFVGAIFMFLYLLVYLLSLGEQMLDFCTLRGKLRSGRVYIPARCKWFPLFRVELGIPRAIVSASMDTSVRVIRRETVCTYVGSDREYDWYQARVGSLGSLMWLASEIEP